MPTLVLATPTNPGVAQWVDAATLGSGWALSGNAVTTGQFLGSTNTEDVVIKRNSVTQMTFAAASVNVTSPLTVSQNSLAVASIQATNANTSGDAILVTAGNISIASPGFIAGRLKLFEPATGGTNFTSFQAQAQAADVNYTLPAAQGAAASFLRNDGAGSLAWGGSLDMANNLITNIGNAGTDFTAGGGLTLAGTFTANGMSMLGLTDIAGSATINTTSIASTSIGNTTANLTLTGIRDLRVYDADTNYSSFSQPAIASNITYTLPAAQGGAATFLRNDGAGALSWAANPVAASGQFAAVGAGPFVIPSAAVAAGNTILVTVENANPAYAYILARTVGVDFTVSVSAAMAGSINWVILP
jgi:hypothetical protein